MRITSSKLAEIVIEVATDQFGDRIFRRRPLMHAVEKELRSRNLWAADYEKLSKSKGIKSKGLAAVDFAISALSKSGSLETHGRDQWRIAQSLPISIAKAKCMVRILPMSVSASYDWILG